MTQSYAVLTKIARPVFPDLVIHVQAPTAAIAIDLVSQGYPDATIRAVMPHGNGRMV